MPPPLAIQKIVEELVNEEVGAPGKEKARRACRGGWKGMKKAWRM
jgi:hypothetical protein